MNKSKTPEENACKEAKSQGIDAAYETAVADEQIEFKKKIIELEAGKCPKCGSENLNYETNIDEGSAGIKYPYLCEDCDFEGAEWYDTVFSAHYDTDGNQL